jgi:hypothetical protein
VSQNFYFFTFRSLERLFSHILVPKEVINEFLIKDGGCRWMNKITPGAVADYARGVA